MTARELSNLIMTNLLKFHPEAEARAMTRLLLSDLYQVETADVVINRAIDWSTSENAQMEGVLERLKQNEPLQYIMGHAWFRGHKFQVNPSVLVPRPETEELVELVVRENQKKQLVVLDIGCGSGCIAISLTRELNQARVHACDLSPAVLEVTEANAEGLEPTLQTHQVDILTHFPPVEQLDIIVSNPPYVLESEKAEMTPGVLEFEPGEALFVPDDDPLKFYTKIAEWAKKKLKPGGRLYLEINEQFGAAVQQAIKGFGLNEIVIHQDMQGKERMIAARK